MTTKIIVDTNVIVAASVIQNISELNLTIRHEFYDQSIQLFSLFKQNKSISGVLVSTVKTESFKVLSKAVQKVFVPNSLNDPKRRELFYNDAVAIISSSEQKMRNLIMLLSKGKYETQELSKNLKDVKKMSQYLRNEWKKKYIKKHWRKQESNIRSKSVMKEPWKQEQKQEVIYAHNAQITRESLQLKRFVDKNNSKDELILAETLSVRSLELKKGNTHQFLIASCDSGFFSPYVHSHLGLSDIVTREIEQRFKIKCHYPRQIYQLVF